MYQTHNTKKKQTQRSRCKKKMLEEFFLFLIHFQNILERCHPVASSTIYLNWRTQK